MSEAKGQSQKPSCKAGDTINGQEIILRLGAELGSPDDQHNMGIWLRDGLDVRQDPEEAVTWFERAANRGHSEAQLSLGACYDLGNGIAMDKAMAVHWYNKAAAQNNPGAIHNLALMHAEGEVPESRRDINKAIDLYLQSAALGHLPAQFNLAMIYDEGAPPEIPQNAREAIKWYQIAAEQGDTDAMFNLGVIFEGEKGIMRDEIQAHMWYTLAADHGDPDAPSEIQALEQSMAEEARIEARSRAVEWSSRRSRANE